MAGVAVVAVVFGVVALVETTGFVASCSHG